MRKAALATKPSDKQPSGQGRQPLFEFVFDEVFVLKFVKDEFPRLTCIIDQTVYILLG